MNALPRPLKTETVANDRSQLTQKGDIGVTNNIGKISLPTAVMPANNDILWPGRSITGTRRVVISDDQDACVGPRHLLSFDKKNLQGAAWKRNAYILDCWPDSSEAPNLTAHVPTP